MSLLISKRFPTESEKNEIIKFDKEGIYSYFSDPYTFDSGIVFCNDRIVGAGIIKVVDEFKVTLDPNLNNFQKAKIIKLLMEVGIASRRTNEIVAFITQGGHHYKEILEKHFNFYDTKSFALKLEL